jgi:hypothetical protein
VSTGKRSTSVHGANYVVHIQKDYKTWCGRVAQLVNCSPDTSQRDELCRTCDKRHSVAQSRLRVS